MRAVIRLDGKPASVAPRPPVLRPGQRLVGRLLREERARP
jgi:hypothetical protein